MLLAVKPKEEKHMLDHISLPVGDIKRATAFYDELLSTLGMTRQRTSSTFSAYARPDAIAPCFWLLPRDDRSAVPGMGLHVSFKAETNAEVDAFHETALRLGAKDAGAPGSRPQYTANFYGAFVIDLDGFKIEATYRRLD